MENTNNLYLALDLLNSIYNELDEELNQQILLNIVNYHNIYKNIEKSKLVYLEATNNFVLKYTSDKENLIKYINTVIKEQFNCNEIMYIIYYIEDLIKKFELFDIKSDIVSIYNIFLKREKKVINYLTKEYFLYIYLLCIILDKSDISNNEVNKILNIYIDYINNELKISESKYKGDE